MLKYSVIIPTYNEEARIGPTVSKVVAFLDALGKPYEVLVVDDGSKDGTVKIVEDYIEQNKEHLSNILKVIKNPHKGKGCTVRTGMLLGEGELLLMTDADSATPIDELRRLELWIEDHGYDVAIGSREGIGSARKGEPLYRHIMGRIFNLIIRVLTLPGIKDTQCGFKMFKHDVAKDVFSSSILFGDDAPTIKIPRVSAFDVEILLIAQRHGYKTKEVPVMWNFGTKSTVSPVRDSINNLLDVLKVKSNDIKGLYKPRNIA